MHAEIITKENVREHAESSINDCQWNDISVKYNEESDCVSVPGIDDIFSECDDEIDCDDDIGDVDDIGSESSDLDDAIDVDCSENCGGSQNSGLLLSTILVIFLRIIHHFKISKNAATAILSFISFLLGKLS